MTEEHTPHPELTPIRAHRIQDPREATTRQFRCTNCGALQECPPSVQPVRETTALTPKKVDDDIVDLFVADPTAETKKQEKKP